MAGRESLPCLLLCLLVVAMCMGGEARQEDRSRYVDQGALYLITNFGFKDGGTAQMNITVENGGHAFILACTTDGWREVRLFSHYHSSPPLPPPLAPLAPSRQPTLTHTCSSHRVPLTV